jgi:hypothetical protein
VSRKVATSPSAFLAPASPHNDHVPWVDADQVVDEVEEFLTGTRPTDSVTHLEYRVLR